MKGENSDQTSSESLSNARQVMSAVSMKGWYRTLKKYGGPSGELTKSLRYRDSDKVNRVHPTIEPQQDGELSHAKQSSPEDVWTNFLHCIVDSICGVYREFEKRFTLRESLSDDALGPLITAFQELCMFLASAPRRADVDRMQDHSVNWKACLAEPMQQWVESTVQERRSDLVAGITRQMFSISKHGQLVDFDYSIRCAMSSNKLSNLEETVILLRFFIKDNLFGDLMSCKEVSFELNKQEFDNLLSDFDDIEQAINDL